MSSSPSPPPTESDLATDLERLLRVGFSECFSEETRKVRGLLLVTSFVLILLTIGVISVGQEPWTVPWLALSITVTEGLRWVLVVLCGYFVVLLIVRSYPEWSLWRLRQESPKLAVSEHVAETVSATVARGRSRSTGLASVNELYERKRQLEKEPPSVTRISEELKGLRQRAEVLNKDLEEKWAHMDDTSDARAALENGIMLELDKVTQRMRELGEKLLKERADSRRQTAEERAALDRQIDEHLSKMPKLEVEVDELVNLLRLEKRLGQVKRVVRTRLWFEIVFPILFGLVAILLGIVAALSDNREQFPTYEELNSFAGAAPVSFQSEHIGRVRFRCVCNGSLGTAVHFWGRFEARVMAKRKKPGIERESAPTVADEEDDTKAIQSWLRTVDKPLAKEKQDREDPEPGDE